MDLLTIELIVLAVILVLYTCVRQYERKKNEEYRGIEAKSGIYFGLVVLNIFFALWDIPPNKSFNVFLAAISCVEFIDLLYKAKESKRSFKKNKCSQTRREINMGNYTLVWDCSQP